MHTTGAAGSYDFFDLFFGVFSIGSIGKAPPADRSEMREALRLESRTESLFCAPKCLRALSFFVFSHAFAGVGLTLRVNPINASRKSY